MTDNKNQTLQVEEQPGTDPWEKLLETYFTQVREKYKLLGAGQKGELLEGLESLVKGEGGGGRERDWGREFFLSEEMLQTYEELMRLGKKGKLLFGSYIRLKRELAGLAPSELAYRGGVSTQTIQRWETGRFGEQRRWDKWKVSRLFRALGDCSDFTFDYCLSLEKRIPDTIKGRRSEPVFDSSAAREVRERAGYGRTKLSEELGLPKSFVSLLTRYENGEVKPRNPPSAEFPIRYLSWLKEQGYNPYNL